MVNCTPVGSWHVGTVEWLTLFSQLSLLDERATGSAAPFLLVHKGLGFSLEALRELSSFTTAANKQFPLEKVDFLTGYGLLPPLSPHPPFRSLPPPPPSTLPGALGQESFLPF